MNKCRYKLNAVGIVIPTLLITIICFYGSTIWTIYISFTHSTMLPNYTFSGMQQYIRLFTTARWNTAYLNMALFGVLMVSGTLAVGILLAVLIDRNVRFEGTLRTIFLYPMAMSFIVTGLAWQWVLSPDVGIQYFVRQLGWHNFVFDWITRPDRAIYTLVFAGIWHQAGLIMVIMLAGMRGIDRDIWRAASIDGIPVYRTYLSIILPMLRNLITVCVVLLAEVVIKAYDLVVSMTGGGPGFSSDLPAKFVVDSTFQRANIGLASAGAVIMLISVFAALTPYLYLQLARREG